MRSHREHVIDVLFPLALLVAFVASAVMVLLLAANIYQQTVGSSAQAYTARTVTAYLSEKIHQNDSGGSVRMGQLGDCPALVLEQGPEGEYRTYIYCHEGVLRELMAGKDLQADPAQGREILELRAFRGEEVSDGLFYFSCTDREDRTASVYVAVRSDRG